MAARSARGPCELVHSPERLRSPLRRVGKKGERSFSPIAWDAALDEITARWQRVIAEAGPLALLGYAYSVRIRGAERQSPQRPVYALGRAGCAPVQSATVLRDCLGHDGRSDRGADPENVAEADLIVACRRISLPPAARPGGGTRRRPLAVAPPDRPGLFPATRQGPVLGPRAAPARGPGLTEVGMMRGNQAATMWLSAPLTSRPPGSREAISARRAPAQESSRSSIVDPDRARPADRAGAYWRPVQWRGRFARGQTRAAGHFGRHRRL